MTYPATLDNLPLTTDGVTPADHVLFDRIISGVNRAQQYVGTTADAASSAPGASISSRVLALEGSAGGVLRQPTAPLAPATSDLWIDTSDADRPLRIFYSSAYHLVGANAVQLRGFPVHNAAPTAGQVLTWDDVNGRWAAAAPTGGMTNPMTLPGQVIYGGTAGAPLALNIGAARQMLVVNTGGTAPEWITAPYIADPSSAPIGALLVKNTSSVWAYVAPSATTGDVLTNQGAGAMPVWAAPATITPGADIPSPAGPRVGAILQWNGTAWDKLLPGTAGQVLTAHGDNNVVGSLLTWTTPAAGGSNPLTTLGDLIIADTGGAQIRLGLPVSGDQSDSVLGVSGGQVAWRKQSTMPIVTFKDWTYQASAPATPAASTGRTYWKTDGKFYGKNAAGTEYDLTVTPAAGSKHVYEDEGTPVTVRTKANFVGTGVTLTDDAINDASIITIPSWYDRLQLNGGTAATQRSHLNYVGSMPVTLTDNPGNDSTDVAIGPDYATALWMGGD